jgi:hypothetical protein
MRNYLGAFDWQRLPDGSIRFHDATVAAGYKVLYYGPGVS